MLAAQQLVTVSYRNLATQWYVITVHMAGSVDWCGSPVLVPLLSACCVVDVSVRETLPSHSFLFTPDVGEHDQQAPPHPGGDL